MADLTPAQRTVLGLIAEGCSNDVIAQRLWVAPETVKFHCTGIYRCLGMNRVQAAVAFKTQELQYRTRELEGEIEYLKDLIHERTAA